MDCRASGNCWIILVPVFCLVVQEAGIRAQDTSYDRRNVMRVSLLRVAVVMAPVGILFLASTIMFARQRCMWAVLQLLGATGVVIVLLAHLCEAAQIFPWMQWGQEQSVGHYVDLSGAVLALV